MNGGGGSPKDRVALSIIKSVNCRQIMKLTLFLFWGVMLSEICWDLYRQKKKVF